MTKECIRCVLPETLPGLQLDEEGVCQYCRQMPSPAKQGATKAGLRARFDELAATVRPRPGAHCLVAWSGGKDSTYTLWLLAQRYVLNVLAFTFDNGFVSAAAFKNMRVVAENLGVDHVIVKPRFDLLRRLFVASMAPGIYPPRALERASGVCNSCMSLAKGIGLQIALEKGIPILAYGWSPGQIPHTSALFHTNPRMLQAMVDAARAPLEQMVGPEIANYFPTRRQIERELDLPYNVAPLAFVEYDEAEAVHQIERLGWERPEDTDPNSTNCLLNGLANLVHLEQTGYHPYAMELASLVRQGHMTRDEALQRLATPPIPEVIMAVEAKLGLPLSQRRNSQ